MTTLNLQVSASTDDAYQASGGTMYLSSTNHTTNSAGRYFGFRFQNVTVPNGATIVTATLQIYIGNGTYDDIHLTITGEDVDDAATFTSTSNDISDRPDTSASVNWDQDGVGSGWQSSPEIKTIIQEIVNRGGWASGQDMVLMAVTTSGVSIDVRFWDFSGNTYGAKLDIEYSFGIPGQVLRSTVFGFGVVAER